MHTFVKRLQANAPTLLALPSIILVMLIAIYPILYAFLYQPDQYAPQRVLIQVHLV